MAQCRVLYKFQLNTCLSKELGQVQDIHWLNGDLKQIDIVDITERQLLLLLLGGKGDLPIKQLWLVN